MGQISEFVGTCVGDTIGLVIANLDPSLQSVMNLCGYRSIGVLGGRVAVGPQVIAVDEALKTCNAELIRMEVARDSKGGAGCGTLFLIGADDVSDARNAVETALQKLPEQFREVYVNEAGHLSFSYTARAGSCCVHTLNAIEGKAFGIICCGPGAIGTLLSDLAVKTASIEIRGYHHPEENCFSNEVILCFSGNCAAVRQALDTAIDAGIKLLGAMGSRPIPVTGSCPAEKINSPCSLCV